MSSGAGGASTALFPSNRASKSAIARSPSRCDTRYPSFFSVKIVNRTLRNGGNHSLMFVVTIRFTGVCGCTFLSRS